MKRLKGKTLMFVLALAVMPSGLLFAPPDHMLAFKPGKVAAMAFAPNMSCAEHLQTAATNLGKSFDEMLWLARLTYSETNKASEMPLVAWVARNRLPTYNDSYTDVALSPRQFSGLGYSGDANYHKNRSMQPGNTSKRWKDACRISSRVALADTALAPIPAGTTHFYSPVSMSPAGSSPSWAKSGKLELTIPGKDHDRFRFYSGITLYP